MLQQVKKTFFATTAAALLLAQSGNALPNQVRTNDLLAAAARGTQTSIAQVPVSGTGAGYSRVPVKGRITRIWALNTSTLGGVTPTIISVSIAGVYVSATLTIPSNTAIGGYINVAVSGTTGGVSAGDIIKFQSASGLVSGTPVTMGATICPNGLPRC